MKAAGGSFTVPDGRDRPQLDLSNLALRPEVPIDADIMVYYASTPSESVVWCYMYVISCLSVVDLIGPTYEWTIFGGVMGLWKGVGPVGELFRSSTLYIYSVIALCFIVDTESYVSPAEGSWLIKNTLGVFQRHYLTRHVEEMLTVVNLAVANELGVAFTETGSRYETAQIPVKHSTLRRTFYLYR